MLKVIYFLASRVHIVYVGKYLVWLYELEVGEIMVTSILGGSSKGAPLGPGRLNPWGNELCIEVQHLVEFEWPHF